MPSQQSSENKICFSSHPPPNGVLSRDKTSLETSVPKSLSHELESPDESKVQFDGFSRELLGKLGVFKRTMIPFKVFLHLIFLLSLFYDVKS